MSSLQNLKNKWDWYSTIMTKFDEGRHEGREEKNIENAKGFKAKGVDINIISEVTGLSKEEIEKL